MSESVLKKEFREKDVNRIRNLIRKDTFSGTVAQTGYEKTQVRHQEGEVWEEEGRKWTIKNGVLQNISRFGEIKKDILIPLACPKCSQSMGYWLHKKMFKIHRMCFDCVVQYEAELRKAGLYEAYEKAMIQGSIKAFLKDLQAWVEETLETKETVVSEDGEVEDWTSTNQEEHKRTVREKLQEYLNHFENSPE